MLDRDLAFLYGVETRVLLQAVKRNLKRFPADFMFQLSKREYKNWRSQIVISNLAAKMAVRRRPHAFTEQGVAMLSSVLRSERAVGINVQIMRAFVRLRTLIATNAQLSNRLKELELRYDEQFKVVFDAIRELIDVPPSKPKRVKGFAPAKAWNRSARRPIAKRQNL